MARYYNSTITLNCWKEHTCDSCGATYAYQFKKKVTGKHRKAEKARIQAGKKAESTLRTVADLHPCPACGVYQSDMIGQKRARWHRWNFWIALLLFATFLVIRGVDGMTAVTTTWVIFAIGAFSALEAIGKELKNFNRDPVANLQKAEGETGAGTMKLRTGQATAASVEAMALPASTARMLSRPLFLIGVLLLGSAEFLRMASGWPANAVAYPPVVGPRDHTRIYMDRTIHSVNGYWRGNPQATLTASDQNPISITATTDQSDWGSSIEVDNGNDDSSSYPWVEIQLPQDNALARQTVQCQLQIDVQYPHSVSSANFEVDNDTLSRTVALKLAPAGAGGVYEKLWWSGNTAGMLMILGTIWALIGGAKRQAASATPTRILVSADSQEAVEPTAMVQAIYANSAQQQPVKGKKA